MRYYWEAVFSTEYFPYWEFTMLMVTFMWLHVCKKIDRIKKR